MKEQAERKPTLRETMHEIADMLRKQAFVTNLCNEEFKEEAEGITAQQIIDLIRDYLKQRGAERDAAVFLNLLATYPKSMVSRNLTTIMRTLITLSYYITQNAGDKETPKLSMDDLALYFHRSKSTINETIRKSLEDK